MKLIYLYRTGVIISIMLVAAQLLLAKRIVNVYPLPRSYYNETKLSADLKTLAKENPASVKLHTIGYTKSGRKPVSALQSQTGIDRIPGLIVGQHHGDEVMGLEIAMAFAKHLLQATTDAKTRDLLDKYSFWIVPTLNPEGWKIVTSGKYQWKRKNNADSNRNGKLDKKTDGVDLHRNYPTFWHLDKGLPESSPFYKGIAPASENEVKALIEIASIVRFRYAFFYHSSVSGSYSEKIYLPWQDIKNKKLVNEFKAMRAVAEIYAAAVDKDYAPGTYSVYPGNTSKIGNSRNHFFYEWGTYAMDIEVCGANKLGVGIVHPGSLMRVKIVQKNLQALIRTLLLTD